MGADASGDSLAFSSTSRPSQRLQTASKVTHSDNVNWAANTWYSLDELKTVVQEVVNRPDWQSGNSLSLVVKGTATGSFARKFVRSVDGAAATAPRLVVSFAGAPVLPTATLNVAPSTVTAGKPSTLSWTTMNAAPCRLIRVGNGLNRFDDQSRHHATYPTHQHGGKRQRAGRSTVIRQRARPVPARCM